MLTWTPFDGLDNDLQQQEAECGAAILVVSQLQDEVSGELYYSYHLEIEDLVEPVPAYSSAETARLEALRGAVTWARAQLATLEAALAEAEQ